MPPRDADLSKLSIQGLMALRDRIDLEIQARREADENQLRLRGGMIERDGPRYQNPHNAAETWSGKGKAPAWIERLRAGGVRLSDLEIIDDRPAPGKRKTSPAKARGRRKARKSAKKRR